MAGGDGAAPAVWAMGRPARAGPRPAVSVDGGRGGDDWAATARLVADGGDGDGQRENGARVKMKRRAGSGPR
jgi:hypothetical protein